MGVSSSAFHLHILGPFRLEGSDGARFAVNSKRSQALIAMLALSGGGERTRNWLQDRLWGSRNTEQAQASLRRELANLRGLLGTGDAPLIESDRLRVWINLKRIKVDARQLDLPGHSGDLLEGLDIAGEEGFEDWLREERAHLQQIAQSSPARVAKTAAPAPQNFQTLPALAILPFANQTGDAANDYRAEGLAEDLIDRMARLHWLPIIARSSSFTFRDADARAAGADLGARYVLEGRLRAEGDTTFLATALVDVETGKLLWSHRAALGNDLAATSVVELLTGISSVLGTRIDEQEQARAMHKPQSDLNVRELIWRGRWHLSRFTKDDAASARECFEQALVHEPTSPEALIQATWAQLWDLWANRGSKEQIRAVRKRAQMAILADYEDARGHMLAGIAEIWLKQPVRAEALLKRAVELNPSLVMAHAQLGCLHNMHSENEQAIKTLEFAVRLSPNDQDLFFTLGELAMAHLMAGDWTAALRDADHALIRRSSYWLAHVVRVNALAQLERVAEAQDALGELLSAKVGFDPAFLDWVPFTDHARITFLKDGLNRARA